MTKLTVTTAKGTIEVGAGIIHDFAGYVVVRPSAKHIPQHGKTFPVLRAGDRLALIDQPMRHYGLGSVASYALQYDECPVEAVERVKARGGDLYYAYALGSCISRDAVKDRYIGIDCDTEYCFEGRIVRFVPAPNNNLKVEVVR